VRLSLFVTDDGSTDGTSEAILALWPEANIQVGSGQLHWAAGMALAEQSAVGSDPDFLLWLNDDTNLKPGALQTLLDLSDELPLSIIVGAAEDPDTGEVTYGGRSRIDWHPQRFRRLPASPAPQRADTFHGNVVLVPMSVWRRVGPIDGAFPHAYADDDYGLRATALAIPILQAPGTLATCRANDDASLPPRHLRARWKHLQSPKSLPWRAQSRYLRRHGDWRWPLILVGQQMKRMTGTR
jgi:GT2 family glycosyltransferase